MLCGGVEVELVQIPLFDLTSLVVGCVGGQDSLGITGGDQDIMGANWDGRLVNIWDRKIKIGVNQGVKGLIVDRRVILDIFKGQHWSTGDQVNWRLV